MDWELFEHFQELRAAGRHEDAIREYLALAGEAADTNEKANLLGGTVTEYCILGRLKEARSLVNQLLAMDASDPEVRLHTDFSDACLLIQEGKREEGAAAFGSIAQRYRELLKNPELRYLYEDIQYRRALALVELSRCAEALLILKEAVSFSFEEVQDEQQINYWLGLCLSDTKDAASAQQAFKRVIELGLRDQIEENARYRLAVLYFRSGGFAQARHRLEEILRDFPPGNPSVPRKSVYEQLSHTCRQLGDPEIAKHYMDLAKNS